ncbi:hypothetical protein [Devosia sp. Leaf64]|uniref:hypothetical protein n=1 Tax=Devosia sp. Leaf64 TaxID=1736229 RepID=UPI000715584C|nr:hypothetical protein [Devosia sp. Leaf64]KQN77494.1 hypothetical protein ASE94_15930 [Devosia sp. Leaf64]
MKINVEVDIAESFAWHIDAAVTRLRYLYPDWSISADVAKVNVSVESDSQASLARREINYALYRERIRAEGAPLRELLLKSVMS